MDLINLDQIIIGPRFRSNPGDLSDLLDSITRTGLLHPIVINGENHLIAGHRRYLVYKKLGETCIPCRIIDLPVELERIAEMEENTVRKDFTNTEIHAIAKYFNETESRQGERTDKKEDELRSNLEQSSNVSDKEEDQQPEEQEPEQEEKDRPIDQTSEATGKSQATVSKINQIMDAKSDDPLIQKQLDEIKEKIDDQSVDKSYNEVKDLTKPKDDKPDSKFLVQLFIDLVKKQDDKSRIFNDLYKILQYPDGAKILKGRVSRYKEKI